MERGLGGGREVSVGPANGPRSASVTPLHWKPALSLKNMNVCFFFPLYNTAKKKKGSRTEVGLSILNKDNLTVA